VIFPADCPHLSDFHFINEVLKDTGIFQHIAKFKNCPMLTVIVTAAVYWSLNPRLILANFTRDS
jgi:hypothetical protein